MLPTRDGNKAYAKQVKQLVGCPVAVSVPCMCPHRCHHVAGYVVPREQLAFSQPTADGCRFAAAYTGCSRFLVYK